MSQYLSRMDRNRRNRRRNVRIDRNVGIENNVENDVPNEDGSYVSRLSRSKARSQSKEYDTEKHAANVPSSIMIELISSQVEEGSVEELPSRRDIYPSMRLKMMKWFYNGLMILFIVIIIGLIWLLGFSDLSK
ncbi:hypothetical protein PASE110613_01555 [Paenibacillus sediminis]|uniref:Uncharacterized protein n=1 Tax=Paenibacillus sediminis TaxID=664909 RepID=A0ABS4GZN0_9BACL|nr:hypothetical protein [Paenibacillus sediminis]MBP1935730.1 hypothetical protein [Paenibacillus sediminis]